MQILQIKISELPSYIESTEYKNSTILPITRARAISQFNNPDASPEDVALLIAINDRKEITGYIGILPGKAIVNGYEEKIFWNSGWWVDPEKGRNISMLLFYNMIGVCRNRILIADLTKHTTKILSYSGFFELPQTKKGIRGFFRFTFKTILPNKFPGLKKAYPAFALADAVLNSLFIPFFLYKKNKFKLSKNYSLVQVKDVDKECSDFIDSAQKDILHFRNSQEINWIIKNPWIRKGNKNNDAEAQLYYFTTIANNFNNVCLKISKNNTIVAVIFLNKRDDELKMPYFFCHMEEKEIVLKILIRYLLNNKAITFTTWHSDFVKYFSEHSIFLMKKEVYLQSAYSKDLSLFQEGFNLQDGDGDMAFT